MLVTYRLQSWQLMFVIKDCEYFFKFESKLTNIHIVIQSITSHKFKKIFKGWFPDKRHKNDHCSRRNINSTYIQLNNKLLPQLLLQMSSPQSYKIINFNHNKEIADTLSYAQRIKEVYIVSQNDKKSQKEKETQHTLSPTQKCMKNDTTKAGSSYPPKFIPFRRSRHASNDRTQQKNSRDKSQQKNQNKLSELEIKSEMQLKIYTLEKKLAAETTEKQNLRSKSNMLWQQNSNYEAKLSNLSQNLNRVMKQKGNLQLQVISLEKRCNQYESEIAEARQSIESLKKSLKQNKINQKSLNNLKVLQNQIQIMTEKNKKMQQENQELTKSYKNSKLQVEKLSKDLSLIEYSQKYKTDQKLATLEKEIQRLKNEKQKTERQSFLEQILQNTQKRLYQRENEIKKLQIQLNFVDRKKTMSIDELTNKKDLQIKDLRKRFMKVSKDLKETKDKIEKTEKKKPGKSNPYIRKVKSSKLLGLASESQQVTFELSSQA